MSRQIEDVLRMLQREFLPYKGHIQPIVYEQLGCSNSKKARWFEKQQHYVCIGCRRYCALANPEGFELALPVRNRRRARGYFAYLPQVSAKSLLESKLVLRVDEAAWVLGVSEREIYNYVDDGRLVRASDLPPLRVTTDSVRQMLPA